MNPWNGANPSANEPLWLDSDGARCIYICIIKIGREMNLASEGNAPFGCGACQCTIYDCIQCATELPEFPDMEFEWDEPKRFRAYGIVDGRVLAVVYTWRSDVCRVISARKANDREQRAYHAALSRVAPDPDG